MSTILTSPKSGLLNRVVRALDSDWLQVQKIKSRNRNRLPSPQEDFQLNEDVRVKATLTLRTWGMLLAVFVGQVVTATVFIVDTRNRISSLESRAAATEAIASTMIRDQIDQKIILVRIETRLSYVVPQIPPPHSP